jgi:hypothetical protein
MPAKTGPWKLFRAPKTHKPQRRRMIDDVPWNLFAPPEAEAKKPEANTKSPLVGRCA